MNSKALTHWIVGEQATLWRELADAIRRANNGVWSIHASDIARRIVGAARLVGPTPPDDVLWTLTGSGIYDTLLTVGALGHEPLTHEYLRQTEELMRAHGGDESGNETEEALRIQFAPTVAAMTSSREVSYIRDEE